MSNRKALLLVPLQDLQELLVDLLIACKPLLDLGDVRVRVIEFGCGRLLRCVILLFSGAPRGALFYLLPGRIPHLYLVARWEEGVEPRMRRWCPTKRRDTRSITF